MNWQSYLSEPREEEVYGVEYWLVSNEWTNNLADEIEKNGGDPYRPSEGTAYHVDIDGKPLVSIDTTQPGEEIEAKLAHEETHIYIEDADLNRITSEAIATARENYYRRQKDLEKPDLTEREMTGSIFKDVIAMDHAQQWTEAYQRKVSQHDDQTALQHAKEATKYQPTTVEKLIFPYRDPYLEIFHRK